MLHIDPIEEQLIIENEFTHCKFHPNTLVEIGVDCPDCIAEEIAEDLYYSNLSDMEDGRR